MLRRSRQLPTLLLLCAWALSGALASFCPGLCLPWDACAMMVTGGEMEHGEKTHEAQQAEVEGESEGAHGAPSCHGVVESRQAAEMVAEKPAEQPVAPSKMAAEPSKTKGAPAEMECCFDSAADEPAHPLRALPAPSADAQLLPPVAVLATRFAPPASTSEFVPRPPDPPHQLARLSLLDRWIL